MLSNYFKILANIVFGAVSFGLIGPYLISFNDTLLVLLGVIYMLVVVPIVFYYFNKKFPLKYINSKEDE